MFSSPNWHQEDSCTQLPLVVLELRLAVPTVVRLFIFFVSVAVGMHVLALVRMAVLLDLVGVKVVVSVFMSVLMFVLVPMTGSPTFVTHDLASGVYQVVFGVRPLR